MGEKVPLIARAVGGRVLGPRPGKAIFTFWQGIVEMVLRTLVLAFSIAAIIPAALVFSDHTKSSPEKSYVKAAGGGLVVGVAVIAMVIELGFIVLRILNIGLLNYKIRIFLLVDAVCSGVLGTLFCVSGILAAYASRQQDNNHPVSTELAAASALSFILIVLVALLGVWSLLFIFNKWNKHVVVYTLKDAVLG